MSLGDLAQGRRLELASVGREQRKPLVDDAVVATQRTHAAVPARAGVTSVLNERDGNRRDPDQARELIERDVADAEQAHATVAHQRFHRGPHLAIGLAQPAARGGAMQHVRIDGARLQVLERTLEGLPNLGREVRSWIVGEPVILPVDEGELGLEEQRLAGAAAGRHELLHGLSHRGLQVVPALIGGVDGAEARAERPQRQLRGAIFLPRRTVDEGRHADVARCQFPIAHGRYLQVK